MLEIVIAQKLIAKYHTFNKKERMFAGPIWKFFMKMLDKCTETDWQEILKWDEFYRTLT